MFCVQWYQISYKHNFRIFQELFHNPKFFHVLFNAAIVIIKLPIVWPLHRSVESPYERLVEFSKGRPDYQISQQVMGKVVGLHVQVELLGVLGFLLGWEKSHRPHGQSPTPTLIYKRYPKKSRYVFFADVFIIPSGDNPPSFGGWTKPRRHSLRETDGTCLLPSTRWVQSAVWRAFGIAFSRYCPLPWSSSLDRCLVSERWKQLNRYFFFQRRNLSWAKQYFFDGGVVEMDIWKQTGDTGRFFARKAAIVCSHLR